jgi:hypothetical protein
MTSVEAPQPRPTRADVVAAIRGALPRSLDRTQLLRARIVRASSIAWNWSSTAGSGRADLRSKRPACTMRPRSKIQPMVATERHGPSDNWPASDSVVGRPRGPTTSREGLIP